MTQRKDLSAVFGNKGWRRTRQGRIPKCSPQSTIHGFAGISGQVRQQLKEYGYKAGRISQLIKLTRPAAAETVEEGPLQIVQNLWEQGLSEAEAGRHAELHAGICLCEPHGYVIIMLSYQ